MRKELIESYINSLRASLGAVRVPVAEEKLRSLFVNKNYAGMVGHIQDILALDLRLILAQVNSGGPDAPAWVPRLTELPMYGTSAFRQLVITVYMRKPFLATACFEEVVCAIAHELCHIVLAAIRHPLQRREEAVDLTAMLLGFRDFYITGCRSVRDVSTQEQLLAGEREIQTRTHGYLTFEEVSYAATYMSFR